jgi:hypothetical protein
MSSYVGRSRVLFTLGTQDHLNQKKKTRTSHRVQYLTLANLRPGQNEFILTCFGVDDYSKNEFEKWTGQPLRWLCGECLRCHLNT